MRQAALQFQPIRYLGIVFVLGALFLFQNVEAQTGTITGGMHKVSPFLGGAVRAYSLDLGDSYAVAVPQSGKFKLSVPPGAYAVIGTMLGKQDVFRQVNVVRIVKSKKTGIKYRSAAPLEVAPGIRTSIGDIEAVAADGKPLLTVSGKPIVLDDLVMTDLMNNNNPCKIRVMEDRKYGRFSEVTKEVKFQSTKYVANRINYKKALSVLKANEPQYRISGNVQVTPDVVPTGNASLRITDLRTGQTVWTAEFTGLSDLNDVTGTLAKRAASALCVPTHITGSFDGVQHVSGSGISVDYTWTGSATFKLGSLIASDPAKPENLDVALYQLETPQITSYATSGTVGGCSVSANAGVTEPQAPSTAAMMVWLTPDTKLGYRYVIAIEFVRLEAVQEIHQCPDGTTATSEAVTAELQVAESEASYPYTQDPYSYQGSFTTGSTTMNWAFTAGL